MNTSKYRKLLTSQFSLSTEGLSKAPGLAEYPMVGLGLLALANFCSSMRLNIGAISPVSGGLFFGQPPSGVPPGDLCIYVGGHMR